MRGIVLAAGMSRRLGAAAGGKPKCLLSVGGKSILERQVSALRTCGVAEITVVVGHGCEYIEPVAHALGFETVYNADYASTNDIASLGAASHRMTGDFVYLHGDVVFEIELLAEVLASTLPIVVGIDRESGDWESEKVRIVDGSVRQIGKHVPQEQAEGEFIGIAVVRDTAAPVFRRALQDLLTAGHVRDYCTSVFTRLIELGVPVHCCEVAGRNWIEIDFPEELARARRLFGRRSAGAEMSRRERGPREGASGAD